MVFHRITNWPPTGIGRPRNDIGMQLKPWCAYAYPRPAPMKQSEGRHAHAWVRPAFEPATP